MTSLRKNLPRLRGIQTWFYRPGLALVRALLALVFLFAGAPQSASSHELSSTAALPTWTKYSVDAPPYFLNMRDRSLAFNPANGVPCIAYGGDALYYSCYNTLTLTWDTVVLDNSLQVGQYTAMTFDNYARPFITYYDAYYARLKLAYFDGFAWNFVIVPNVDDTTTSSNALYETGPTTDSTAVAETPEASPTEADAPGSEATPAPESAPTEAQAMIPPPPPTDETTPPEWSRPTPPSVQADSSAATPAVEEEPTTQERIQQVLQPWMSQFHSAAPSFPFESYGYGKYSSIAIDRNNGIHISYYDEIDGSLEYQYWNGLTWSGKVVDDYNDQGDVGLWSSIKVDYNFNVHIAYMSEKYDDLKYAFRRATGGWTITEVDTTANVGSFASIALDSRFRPHIAYYDFSGDRLKYAWKDGSGVWRISVIDSGGGEGSNVGWFAAIAIDPGDRVHISYYNVSRGDLKYARYDGQWTTRSLDVTNTRNIGLFTSIAIDRFGRPGIAYMDGTLGALKFIYSPNQTRWNAPQYVNYYSRDVGLSTSLAVNDAGVPFISYLDASSGALKFARTYGLSWSKRTLVSSPFSGLYSSIDLAGPGSPRIAYYQQENGDAYYAQWLSTYWSFSPIQRTYDVGQHISLDIDSVGIPHISLYDVTNRDLVYASWNVTTSKWYTQTVDFENTVGWYTDIAVNTSNEPFISYYDPTNGSLKVAYRAPVTLTWIRNTVDNIGQLQQTGVGAYSSIAIDNLGRPHISYYDITNHVLKYAYWDGVWGGAGTWNISVVDPASDVGRFSSLVINPADNTRHICYYDYTNGNLKYARWEGAGPWERQVVDGAVGFDGDAVDEGDVGLFCSIDLNAAGEPTISYYDNSHGDLKVAMSYALPPAEIYLPLVVLEP